MSSRGPESRSIQAETDALQARSARLAAEGRGGSSASLGGEEATLSAVRQQALGSRVAALRSSAKPATTSSSMSNDLANARAVAKSTVAPGVVRKVTFPRIDGSDV